MMFINYNSLISYVLPIRTCVTGYVEKTSGVRISSYLDGDELACGLPLFRPGSGWLVVLEVLDFHPDFVGAPHTLHRSRSTLAIPHPAPGRGSWAHASAYAHVHSGVPGTRFQRLSEVCDVVVGTCNRDSPFCAAREDVLLLPRMVSSLRHSVIWQGKQTNTCVLA